MLYFSLFRLNSRCANFKSFHVNGEAAREIGGLFRASNNDVTVLFPIDAGLKYDTLLKINIKDKIETGVEILLEGVVGLQDRRPTKTIPLQQPLCVLSL